MLVLSRYKGQRIILDNGQIVITVVDTGEDKVRLGIDAPKEMSIHREEIYEAIKKEGEKRING